MSWLITMLVGNAVIAIPLTLLATTAGWLRRPAVAHALWLLVLLKLVTPPIVQVRGTWGLSERRGSDVTGAASFQPSEIAPMVQMTVSKPVEGVRMVPPEVDPAPIESVNATIARGASTRSGWNFSWWIGVGWVGGSLVYLVVVARRVERFRSLLKQAAPAEGELAQLVRDVGARMGGRVPDVRVVPVLTSPMLFSIGRAVMIVPDTVIEKLSPAQQRAIVAHELAHLRRGDHWVRFLEVIATALLWWHPLLWLARRGLHEAEEQCCDAWVVAMMPEQESRRAYADALVDVLEMTCATPLPALASGLGRMTHLKRRLTMIVDRTPAKSLSLWGKVVVLALAALLPLAPVRGDEPKKSQTKAASAPAVDDSTRKAVESLLEMAQDENSNVQTAGADAIVNFGSKAVPVLIEALGNQKSALAAQALLPRMGVDAVEALIEGIESPDAAVRERSLLTLEAILDPNGSMMAVEGMRNPRSPGGFRPGAGMVPGGEGVPIISPLGASIATWVIAPASKASTDSNPSVRRAAVRVLGAASRVLPDPSIATPLAAALKDDDSTVRRLAAQAIVNVARLAPNLSAPLAEGVKDSDPAVRVSTLNALGSVGSAAKSAMPVLTAALKDPDPNVRIAAANALGAMQAPPLQMGPMVGLAGGGYTALSDSPIPTAAENLWHWIKLGRIDQAKAEADRIMKLDPNPEVLYQAFAIVAQSRNDDLATWMKRIKDIKELKELVGVLEKGKEMIRTNAAGFAPPGVAGPEGGGLPGSPR